MTFTNACPKCTSRIIIPISISVEPQVSFTSPDGWENRHFVDYKCADCKYIFWKALPKDTSVDAVTAAELAKYKNAKLKPGYSLGRLAGKFGNFTHRASNKVISSVQLNRRVKTAGIDDIKSVRRVEQDTDDCLMTQIDLQLEVEEK